MAVFIIVVAMDLYDRIIGIDGKIPWEKIPSDMERFEQITLGHPVIMGRKTWDSLPQEARPLPGRKNIVLTRDAEQAKNIRLAGAVTAASLDEAKRLVAQYSQAYIIGGGEVYREVLPFAEWMVITYVSRILTASNTAVYFPEWNEDEWMINHSTSDPLIMQRDPRDPWYTSYWTLGRIKG